MCRQLLRCHIPGPERDSRPPITTVTRGAKGRRSPAIHETGCSCWLPRSSMCGQVAVPIEQGHRDHRELQIRARLQVSRPTRPTPRCTSAYVNRPPLPLRSTQSAAAQRRRRHAGRSNARVLGSVGSKHPQTKSGRVVFDASCTSDTPSLARVVIPQTGSVNTL